MTESSIYFTTFHGPIVGEVWRDTGISWGDVEIVEITRPWDTANGSILVRGASVEIENETVTAINKVYRWGKRPFRERFTRVP